MIPQCFWDILFFVLFHAFPGLKNWSFVFKVFHDVGSLHNSF